ncbi:hypothetical protein TNCV_1870651 [Trichonephila clavipes]|nr:hypothetical protein TNCV_1870651 [Trichonephila clavipes]
MPPKTHLVERLMPVKSVEAQSPPVGWHGVLFGDGVLLKCHPCHMIEVQNYEVRCHYRWTEVSQSVHLVQRIIVVRPFAG